MIFSEGHLRAVAIMGCAFFCGCVQVGPKQFAVPRGIVAAQDEKPCDPNEPPPIPETAHISIEPGRPVQADAGGEALLRAYVAMREKRKL